MALGMFVVLFLLHLVAVVQGCWSNTAAGSTPFRLNFLKPTEAREEFRPSMANDGWHEKGPLPLGQGLGSGLYVQLTEIWNNLADKTLFNDQQMVEGRRLASILMSAQSDDSREEYLSCRVSIRLSKLVRAFGASEEFLVCHQWLPDDTSKGSADYVFTDENDRVYAIGETRWRVADDEFPEAQAAAYGPFFDLDNKFWFPVFVLSKNHVRFGVTNGGILSQWIYSEIYTHEVAGSFDPANNDHVYVLLRTIEFVINAARHHRDYKDNDGMARKLLDAHFNTLLAPPCTVLASEVIQGSGADGKKKVLKFYSNRSEAELAVQKRQMICGALGRPMTAFACEGIGSNSIGAVLDDFIDGCGALTSKHFESLARSIDTLHGIRLVHGDLRSQNIIPLESGEVELIDCDWSGAVGSVKFPSDVNTVAFGRFSAKYAIPSVPIPAKFDWYCLADLLDYCGYGMPMIEAALAGSKDQLVQQLTSKSFATMSSPSVFGSNCSR